MTAPEHRTSSWHPAEVIAVAAVGAVMLTATLLWTAAGVGSLLAGNGWASGPWSDMPGVAKRLVDHPGDPAAAWPASARSRLPGPLFFYCALAALLAGGTVAARWTWRLAARRKAPSAAAWATRGALKRLTVAAPELGRIVLGRHSGRLVATESGQSALVVAPTQSGKTTALAIPAILEWQGPVIALSVKTDLLRDTVRRRMELGRVAVFDPTDSTGLAASSSWSPLLACQDWAGARRAAAALADGAAPSKRSLSDGDFWYSAAAKLLAPLLYAAATSGLTMDEVVGWVDTQESSAVLAALEVAGSQEALNAMQANWSRDDRQRSSVYTTAETILEAYADPGVLAHSRVPEIRPEWLLDGGAHTLYLCGSAREQRRLRPVFVALVQEVLEAAYALAGHLGGPLDPPLLLVLDEVANLAPIADLDVIASTGAGHGVQLVTILQDLAQAYDRWGRERADTIINNHRAKVLGAGLADERALEWVARLLGEQSVAQRSRTSGDGRASVTDSNTYRPLAPANVVREAPAGRALLIYGTLPPAWIRLRPWFADRHLTALANGSARD